MKTDPATVARGPENRTQNNVSNAPATSPESLNGTLAALRKEKSRTHQPGFLNKRL